MKTLLIITAVIEAATGIALLAAPVLLASVLLGASLDTAPGLLMARLAGVALLSLGVACGFAGRDAQGRAAAGVVAAMLLYNVAAAVLLGSARFCLGMTGMGLLPTVALHTGLAAWCIVCLRAKELR